MPTKFSHCRLALPQMYLCIQHLILVFFCVLLPSTLTFGADGFNMADAVRSQRAKSYFGNGKLFDQDGVEHHFYNDLLQGHIVLINVVYTQCKDACPMITRLLGLAKDRLGEDFGHTVFFLSLSSDPNHDTPETMKTFARKHHADHPGWRFLSGKREVMEPLLRRLGQWSDDPADHRSLLLAGNTAQAHWVKIRPDATPEYIAAELRRVAHSPQ